VTGTSVWRKGANRHAEILFWKSDLEKAAGARAATAAGWAAEAEAVVAKHDLPRAADLLRDPDTCHTFYARAAGKEWRPRQVGRRAGQPPSHPRGGG
jgi:hypothetical protein